MFAVLYLLVAGGNVIDDEAMVFEDREYDE
jgi:hypothetical protein